MDRMLVFSENKCPKCGAALWGKFDEPIYNTKAEAAEPFHARLEIPFTCENCGFDGVELFNMVYKGTTEYLEG